MIIELYGLPAVGKSTLAENLSKISDFKIIKIRGLFELFWYNFIFLIKNPIKFFVNFLYILKNSNSWPMFYFKFVNCLLQYNAKHEKAKKFKNAIIDQGHFQNVVSVFEKPISESQLKKYLRYLPLPNFLIILEADENNTKEREAARGYFGREHLGEAYQKNWRQVIWQNNKIFKKLLLDQSVAVNYKVIDIGQSNENLSQEVLKLINFSKPEINYLANIRIPTEMGHGYQIAKTCESLGNLGYNLTLWVPARKNKITESAFRYYQIKESFKIKTIKNIDFLSWPRSFGYFKFLLQRISFLIVLLFKNFSTESIIYSRDSDVVFLMKLRGYRTIYECHEWFMRHKFFPLLFLRNADKIITTNTFIKEQFLKNGFNHDKILVLPNGIDLEKFDLIKSKNEAISELDLIKKTGVDLTVKKVLFYSGSLRLKGVEKGVDEILKAVKILNDKNIYFLAVGGNEKDINYYRLTAKGLGVLDQVSFFERQPQAALALFQKVGDIMMMPFPKKVHYEFFMSPLKTFEYMASRRPIISSDLPSVREMLNDNNCIFCQPNNPEDLANKIRLILNNNDLADKMASQAYEDVKKYAWSKRAEKIIDFI